jgi:hypothetical protein
MDEKAPPDRKLMQMIAIATGFLVIIAGVLLVYVYLSGAH